MNAKLSKEQKTVWRRTGTVWTVAGRGRTKGDG